MEHEIWKNGCEWYAVLNRESSFGKRPQGKCSRTSDRRYITWRTFKQILHVCRIGTYFSETVTLSHSACILSFPSTWSILILLHCHAFTFYTIHSDTLYTEHVTSVCSTEHPYCLVWGSTEDLSGKSWYYINDTWFCRHYVTFCGRLRTKTGWKHFLNIILVLFCVCVCVYIYIYIYTYIHTYTHTYIYIHTYTHTHTHIYIYIYICMFLCYCLIL